MPRSILLLAALLLLSQCHYERYVVREVPDGRSLKKHSLLTTRDTPRKLDTEVAEAEPPTPAPSSGLAGVPLVTFPRNYSGHATVTVAEEGFVANLIFASENERNDSLMVTGSYSVDNKQTFSPLELMLPLDLFATSDPSRGEQSVSFTNNFTFALLTSDTLREGPAGEPLDTPLVVIDTLPGAEYLASDSLLLAYGIDVHQNTETVTMLSGVFAYGDASLRFATQSDPLPLVPILVGAALSYGSYKAKQAYDAYQKRKQEAARRERARARLRVLAQRRE